MLQPQPRWCELADKVVSARGDGAQLDVKVPSDARSHGICARTAEFILRQGRHLTHAVASHTPAGRDFPSPATKASALEASGPTPTWWHAGGRLPASSLRQKFLRSGLRTQGSIAIALQRVIGAHGPKE